MKKNEIFTVVFDRVWIFISKYNPLELDAAHRIKILKIALSWKLNDGQFHLQNLYSYLILKTFTNNIVYLSPKSKKLNLLSIFFLYLSASLSISLPISLQLHLLASLRLRTRFSSFACIPYTSLNNVFYPSVYFFFSFSLPICEHYATNSEFKRFRNRFIYSFHVLEVI